MAALTDDTILAKLQSDSPEEQNQAFEYLYATEYKAVRAFVTRNHGTRVDAQDVFQDALVVLYTNLRQDNLVLRSSLHTYLQSVCRNIWKKKRRDKKPTVDLESMADPPFEPSHLEVLQADEKTKVMADYIARLGEECQRILTLYYFERVRIKKIAELLEISGEAVAKNRKARCMKNLRSLTEDDELFKTLLSR